MRILFWTFAVLAVIGGAVSTRLWHGLRIERELSESLRTQVAEAASRELMIARQPPAAAPVTAAAPASATVAAEPEKPAASPPASPSPASLVSRNIAEEQRELWKDPEYRKARLAQIRTTIPRNYPGLAEELGLSPAEADKLFDVMAQNELNTSSSLSLVIAGSNDPAASKELSARLQESTRQRDEAIAATLGPARYAQWQEYQQSSGARVQVNSYNNMLTQSGQPLSKEQLKSFTAVMNTEMQRQRQEAQTLARNLDVRDPAQLAQVQEESRRRQEVANQRVLAAAAAVLTPQQLEVIRTQMEQQAAMSRALMRVSERQRAAAQTQQQGAP